MKEDFLLLQWFGPSQSNDSHYSPGNYSHSSSLLLHHSAYAFLLLPFNGELMVRWYFRNEIKPTKFTLEKGKYFPTETAGLVQQDITWGLSHCKEDTRKWRTDRRIILITSSNQQDANLLCLRSGSNNHQLHWLESSCCLYWHVQILPRVSHNACVKRPSKQFSQIFLSS